MKMIEICLAILLAISLTANIVFVKGVKIEVNQTQVQTTMNDIRNDNINENINTVNVESSKLSITNKSIVSIKECSTNSVTNLTGSTNYLFK